MEAETSQELMCLDPLHGETKITPWQHFQGWFQIAMESICVIPRGHTGPNADNRWAYSEIRGGEIKVDAPPVKQESPKLKVLLSKSFPRSLATYGVQFRQIQLYLRTVARALWFPPSVNIHITSLTVKTRKSMVTSTNMVGTHVTELEPDRLRYRVRCMLSIANAQEVAT